MGEKQLQLSPGAIKDTTTFDGDGVHCVLTLGGPWWIRTYDLRVTSPTICHCHLSPPDYPSRQFVLPLL